MDTGTTLRQSRLNAGLTQAELAKRSGTSQATLCSYERGHKSPNADTLARVLAATGHKLSVERASCAVVTPSRRRLERNARTLLQVLDLAAELPTRHKHHLAYPPLRTIATG